MMRHRHQEGSKSTDAQAPFTTLNVRQYRRIDPSIPRDIESLGLCFSKNSFDAAEAPVSFSVIHEAWEWRWWHH